MDRHTREREMASVLISSLYSEACPLVSAVVHARGLLMLFAEAWRCGTISSHPASQPLREWLSGARRQASRQDFGYLSSTVQRLQVLAPDAVARGLLEAVAAVEDLRLDVPDSPDVVATFVSRAIVDDVLPPSFVDSIPAGASGVVLVTCLMRPECECHAVLLFIRNRCTQARTHARRTCRCVCGFFQQGRWRCLKAGLCPVPVAVL